MKIFVSGITFTLSLTIALFFIRFWTKTKDRLFILFAIAFTLLAIERILLVFFENFSEVGVPVYTVRLIAFVIIILGILDKNVTQRQL